MTEIEIWNIKAPHQISHSSKCKKSKEIRSNGYSLKINESDLWALWTLENLSKDYISKLYNGHLPETCRGLVSAKSLKECLERKEDRGAGNEKKQRSGVV